MTREIKFRQLAHNADAKCRFHYWGFIAHTTGMEFIGPITGNDSMDNIREHSDRFTGLRDNNGKEIYEGDILKYLPSTPPIIKDVKWHERGWLNTEGNLVSEVIGNIHENPDLLDVSNA